MAEPETSGTNKTWGTVSALEDDRLETGECWGRASVAADVVGDVSKEQTFEQGPKP